MVDERLDDDRLAAVLASVGEHLVVAAPTAPRRSGPTGGPGDVRLLVAAAALIVVAGAIVAIAPARRVVSGWFGAGRIEVEIDRAADPTGLPSFAAPAERIDPAAADEVLGRAMPPVGHSALGAPSEWATCPKAACSSAGRRERRCG